MIKVLLQIIIRIKTIKTYIYAPKNAYDHRMLMKSLDFERKYIIKMIFLYENLSTINSYRNRLKCMGIHKASKESNKVFEIVPNSASADVAINPNAVLTFPILFLMMVLRSDFFHFLGGSLSWWGP